MKTIVVCLAAFSMACVPAFAGSKSENCKLLVDPANQSATGARNYLAALESLDNLGKMKEFLSDNERTAVEEFMKAREELITPLKNFAEKNEDLAYALLKCARR